MKESMLEKWMHTELIDWPIDTFIDKWIGPPMSEGRADFILYIVTGLLVLFLSYCFFKSNVDRFMSSGAKLTVFFGTKWMPIYIPILIILWPLILVLEIFLVLMFWMGGLLRDIFYAVGMRA